MQSSFLDVLISHSEGHLRSLASPVSHNSTLLGYLNELVQKPTARTRFTVKFLTKFQKSGKNTEPRSFLKFRNIITIKPFSLLFCVWCRLKFEIGRLSVAVEKFGVLVLEELLEVALSLITPVVLGHVSESSTPLAPVNPDSSSSSSKSQLQTVLSKPPLITRKNAKEVKLVCSCVDVLCDYQVDVGLRPIAVPCPFFSSLI